jgi:hypothetical protein
VTLQEPAVTLTDYGLAVECAVLVWLVRRHQATTEVRVGWFASFFGALGVAALLGGTAHGFGMDESSRTGFIVWSATLLAIGWAALSAWAIGGPLVLAEEASGRLLGAAVAVYAAYAAVVLLIDQSFAVAVVHYLPAALFLLAAFLVVWWRERRPAWLIGALGLVLTLVAGGTQQARIGLHPRYFDHNALYHLIQAAALVLLYVAARDRARSSRAPARLHSC